MKKRFGFVSNSSSSSFVAVGFSLKENKDRRSLMEAMGVDVEQLWKEYLEQYEKNVEKYSYYTQEDYEEIKSKGISEDFLSDISYEFFDESGYRVLNGGEDGVADDDFVVVEMISDVASDEYAEGDSFSFSELQTRFVGIEKLRQKIAPDVEMMVYTGTRMC